MYANISESIYYVCRRNINLIVKTPVLKNMITYSCKMKCIHISNNCILYSFITGDAL